MKANLVLFQKFSLLASIREIKKKKKYGKDFKIEANETEKYCNFVSQSDINSVLR